MRTSPKLRNFQYRLLLNKVVTNVDLNTWKIKSSPKCTFCEQQDETSTYLMYSCPYTSKIYEYIVNKLADFKMPNIKRIILNDVHNNDLHIVNLIVLILKQYLYKYRGFKKKPTMKTFVTELQHFYFINEYKACITMKSGKFYKYWEPVMPLLR